MADWLPAAIVPRLLKTDLFDEALGEGLYVLLTSKAKSRVGMDLSFDIVQAARARYTALAAIRGDIRLLPFADEAFDIVVSNSTLDHFDSKAHIIVALRELRRVLRTGGHLLLTLDNPMNPLIALRNSLPFPLWQRMGVVPYYVGVTLGPVRLRRTLVQLGFEGLERVIDGKGLYGLKANESSSFSFWSFAREEIESIVKSREAIHASPREDLLTVC